MSPDQSEFAAAGPEDTTALRAEGKRGARMSQRRNHSVFQKRGHIIDHSLLPHDKGVRDANPWSKTTFSLATAAPQHPMMINASGARDFFALDFIVRSNGGLTLPRPSRV